MNKEKQYAMSWLKELEAKIKLLDTVAVDNHDVLIRKIDVFENIKLTIEQIKDSYYPHQANRGKILLKKKNMEIGIKKHIKPCNCETCKNFLQEALAEERKRVRERIESGISLYKYYEVGGEVINIKDLLTLLRRYY